MDKNKRTEISSLGEFKLIDRICAPFQSEQKSTVKEAGDDAAVIDAGNRYILLSNDLMLEGVNFDLTYFPLQHLGYKAVVVGISDILAMNGTPRQILIALGVSSRFSVEMIDLFYEGIRAACQDYHVDLVGGDTSASVNGLTLSITATGDVGCLHVNPSARARKESLQRTTQSASQIRRIRIYPSPTAQARSPDGHHRTARAKRYCSHLDDRYFGRFSFRSASHMQGFRQGDTYLPQPITDRQTDLRYGRRAAQRSCSRRSQRWRRLRTAVYRSVIEASRNIRYGHRHHWPYHRFRYRSQAHNPRRPRNYTPSSRMEIGF